MKNILRLVPALALAGFLASCATSIPVTVDHPSRIDMGSIRTIGVQPFLGRSPNYIDRVPDGIRPGFKSYDHGRNVGIFVSDAIRQTLARSGRYSVLDMSSSRFPGSPKPDAYIAGEILDYSISNTLAIDVRTDKNGIRITYWITRKEVHLSFVYSLIDNQTGRVIDRVYKEGKASDQAERSDFLFVPFDDYSLLGRIMDRIIPEIEKELMPWRETVHLSFEMKDDDPQYKVADGLVKNHQYGRAYDIYMDAYRRMGDYRAGYNAALLLFAMDRKEEAIGQMKEIADRYDFSKAKYQYLWMLEAYEDEHQVRKSGFGL